MPLVPNALERLIWLRMNRAPGPFLDLFAAGGFRAVGLALDMGLFEVLAEGPRSRRKLAEHLDVDERGISVLLSLLDALGYVTQSGDGYQITAMTRAWLAPGHRTAVGPWLAFWVDLVFPYWDEHLATAVREGEPPMTIYEWFDEEPERWETAQRGFAAVARLTAPDVVDRVSLPSGATRLLDVGGGHGHYSVALCRAHPDLSATVFDSAEAVEVARETAEDAGLADRIDVHAGDYFVDEMPAADVVLLFNVIHAHRPAENAALFERLRATLDVGDRVIVMDQFETDSWTARALPTVRTALAFVALTYLVTLGGRTYPIAAVESWLREAGFGNVRRLGLRRAPGVSLLVADASG